MGDTETMKEASRASMLLFARHTYSPESAMDSWCSRRREPWACGWTGKEREREGSGQGVSSGVRPPPRPPLSDVLRLSLSVPGRRENCPRIAGSRFGFFALGAVPARPTLGGKSAALTATLHSVPGVGQEDCPLACTT